MKHFKLDKKDSIHNKDGVQLYRIIATKDSFHAKKGTKGGYVATIDNINDEAWVADNAQISNGAVISGKALLKHNAIVQGPITITDEVVIYENANIIGNGVIRNKCIIGQNANILCDNFTILGNVQIFKNVKIIEHNVYLNGIITISNDVEISNNVLIHGRVNLSGNVKIKNAHISGTVDIYANIIICSKKNGLLPIKINGCYAFCSNVKIEEQNDFLSISNLGEYNRTITLTKSNKKIKCGCNIFSLAEFKKAVRKKYKNPTKDNYYFVFDLIEKFFNS